MRPHFSERFIRSYISAPPAVQQAFDRKLGLLLENLRHPSLRAKKYDEARDLWQARVNVGWRFYFRIQGDTYELIDITAHPK
jgi:plasmid maintenance system killer protein